MTTAEASVAVIITCFNEGRFIQAAVQSVLAQTAERAIGQIIIADDGSEPDTLDILHAIAQLDSRINVLFGPGGARQAAQRNMAVRQTELPFIAFLDGDDLWHQDKLAEQLLLCESDPSIGLVYTGFSNFSGDGIDKARPARLIDISDAKDLAIEYFRNDPPILPSTIFVRRDIYEGVGGMDPTIHCFEETEFYLRLARFTRFGCLPNALVLKRNRETSITGGRPDLMAFHAFVALKAAAANPHLLALVPSRLAERARKLANQHFVNDNVQQARLISALAVRMAPFTPGTWMAWILARLPNSAANLLRRTLLASRVEVRGKPNDI